MTFQAYGKNLGFDVLGLGTAGVGNLRSNAEVSFAVRLGSNLKFSHATFSLQSDRQVNALSLGAVNDFYVFFGAVQNLLRMILR